MTNVEPIRRSFTLPTTFDAVNRRKDRSLSLRFSSTLEVSTDHYAEMDRLIPSTGWLMFSPNQFNETDIPKDDAPSDTKKPSVRLRATLFVWWTQNADKAEAPDFEAFYRGWIEKRIEGLKAELD